MANNEIYQLVGEQHIPVIVAKAYTLSDGKIALYTKVTGNGAEAVFGYNVQELN